jgi:acetylornithine deacetylase/succinyl-diaminopimelate desuccinylase-like protein
VTGKAPADRSVSPPRRSRTQTAGELLFEDVQELAGRIGPRGTGTSAEGAARDYVAARLAALGLPVARREFRATHSQNAFPLASVALALLAVAVYPCGGAAGRRAAAALALPTAPLLWRAIRLSTNPLHRLLPSVRSGNVVATVAPRERSEQRVVLLAHLDTNRARLAWRSGAVRWLEPMTWLTLGMLGLLGGLYAAGAATRSRVVARRLWRISLVPAAYAVAVLVTLVREERTPFSPGAHDNAASVAVTLDTARTLATRPLRRTEVVLAFTGAEETDHAGLYALLRDEPAAMRAAAFVGLEGLGSGRLTYLAREGLCDHVRADAALLGAAARAAARRPELGVAAGEMTLEDEVTTLRRRGYRAICIAGVDPCTGSLPHWHRTDDTADTVSATFLRRASSYVCAVLEEIDGPDEEPERSAVAGHAREEAECVRS